MRLQARPGVSLFLPLGHSLRAELVVPRLTASRLMLTQQILPPISAEDGNNSSHEIQVMNTQNRSVMVRFSAVLTARSRYS